MPLSFSMSKNVKLKKSMPNKENKWGEQKGRKTFRSTRISDNKVDKETISSRTKFEIIYKLYLM